MLPHVVNGDCMHERRHVEQSAYSMQQPIFVQTRTLRLLIHTICLETYLSSSTYTSFYSHNFYPKFSMNLIILPTMSLDKMLTLQ